MLAEASAGALEALGVVGRGGAPGLRCCCACSKCAVVAEEAESEGAPVHPGGAERIGLPATPRGMMRRDGEEGREEEEDEEGVEEEASGDEGAAAAAAAVAAAAAAPLLFLEETAEVAVIFGLRSAGSCFFGCWIFFFFVLMRVQVEKKDKGKKRKLTEHEEANSRKFDSAGRRRIQVVASILRAGFVLQETHHGR